LPPASEGCDPTGDDRGNGEGGGGGGHAPRVVDGVPSTTASGKPEIPFAPAARAFSRADADDKIPEESVDCVEDAT